MASLDLLPGTISLWVLGRQGRFGPLLNSSQQAINGQIGHTICLQITRQFFQTHFVGNQLFPGRNVDAHVTGMANWWTSCANMNLQQYRYIPMDILYRSNFCQRNNHQRNLFIPQVITYTGTRPPFSSYTTLLTTDHHHIIYEYHFCEFSRAEQKE